MQTRFAALQKPEVPGDPDLAAWKAALNLSHTVFWALLEQSLPWVWQ